jgi:hypothetical protein
MKIPPNAGDGTAKSRTNKVKKDQKSRYSSETRSEKGKS